MHVNIALNHLMFLLCNSVMNSSNVPLQLRRFRKAFPQMSQVYVFTQMNSNHMMPQVHFLYPYSSAKLENVLPNLKLQLFIIVQKRVC